MGGDCVNRVTKFLSECVLLHCQSLAPKRPILLSAIFSAPSMPLSLSPHVERQPVSFSTGSRSELSTICPLNVTEILAVRMWRDTASSVSERGRVSAGTFPRGEPQWWLKRKLRMTLFQITNIRYAQIDWPPVTVDPPGHVRSSGIYYNWFLVVLPSSNCIFPVYLAKKMKIVSASLKLRLWECFPALLYSTLYKGCNQDRYYEVVKRH